MINEPAGYGYRFSDDSRCDLYRAHREAHPAWPPFLEEMKGKQYGQEETAQAWYFFCKGYDARS